MSKHAFKALAGSGLLAIACAATAQEGSSTSTGASAGPSSVADQVEEIIVTARRRAESLEDVPQTIDVVNSESIQKYNILQFGDVQGLVPGLTLTSGANGYTTAATLRGASFQVESGARPTVE